MLWPWKEDSSCKQSATETLRIVIQEFNRAYDGDWRWLMRRMQGTVGFNHLFHIVVAFLLPQLHANNPLGNKFSFQFQILGCFGAPPFSDSLTLEKSTTTSRANTVSTTSWITKTLTGLSCHCKNSFSCYESCKLHQVNHPRHFSNNLTIYFLNLTNFDFCSFQKVLCSCCSPLNWQKLVTRRKINYVVNITYSKGRLREYSEAE